MSPIPLFTVRRYITVKEVRLHSERGKATVAGVVGIVASMPCCGTGVTAPVTSWVRTSCAGSLVPGARVKRRWRPTPRGVGRGGTCARGQRGVGRGGNCARGQGGSGEPVLAPEPWESCMVCFVFCDFYCSDLGIPFYGTQQYVCQYKR